MDKNEAIEILRKGYPDINRYAASELEAYEYDVEIYNEAVGYAISHLEADRWISVKDKLPEEYGNYLVLTSENNIDFGTFNTRFGSWSMCDADGFYWAGQRGIRITHWRHLPKAPESEAKNE